MQLQHQAPPGQQFRWLLIERDDGTTNHYPYVWPTEAELAGMTPEHIKELEEQRNTNLWLWAEDLENGKLHGAKVVRIIDDWTGTMVDYVKKVEHIQ